MSAIDKVIQVALGEVGNLEKASDSNLYSKTGNAGYGNYTKYGKEMHKICPETMDYPAPWCDSFHDWCHVQAFGAEKAAELLHGFDDYTVASADKFKKAGEWYTSPVRGDQIFFKDSGGGICHTGLVIAVDNGRVYTVEGNTSSADGVIDNGGCVAKKSYPLNYGRIAGYGRPNYKLVEGDDLSVTQYEELKGMIQKIAEAVNAAGEDIQALKEDVNELNTPTIYDYMDENIPGWSREAIQWCMDNGILAGIKGEDGITRLNLTDDKIWTLNIIYRIIKGVKAGAKI